MTNPSGKMLINSTQIDFCDVKGSDLRLAPAGRGVCPCRALDLATVNHWVARLLHHFDFVCLYKAWTEKLKLFCEMVNLSCEKNSLYTNIPKLKFRARVEYALANMGEMLPPPPRAPKELEDIEKQQENNRQEQVSPPDTEHSGVRERPYMIPEWSHAPGKPYTLEVLKEGVVVNELQVSDKGAYMFGRHESCDFPLDHPSISRYHAVIQYNAKGDAFLCDLGSTHGTSVNKQAVKAKVLTRIFVGNIIRFGLSSRLYIFQGPEELMPEEGLSRQQRHTLRKLEAIQARVDEEASIERAKRDAIDSNGVSWGMEEDAYDDETEGVEEEVTWQTYKGTLTERQQKTMDQIHRRNEKLTNLKKEIDAIQAKEGAQGGLTQGQQTQVARNEQRIEQLLEELENLEETLNDSIRESVYGKEGKPVRGKRKVEYEEDEVSDDDYYDRTSNKKKKKGKGGDGVETAESLLAKEDELAKKIEGVLEKLRIEEMSSPSPQSKAVEEDGRGNDGDDVADPLDAFMSDVSSKIVDDAAARLRREVERLQGEVERVKLLIKVADPSGEVVRRWRSKTEVAVVVVGGGDGVGGDAAGGGGGDDAPPSTAAAAAPEESGGDVEGSSVSSEREFVEYKSMKRASSKDVVVAVVEKENAERKKDDDGDDVDAVVSGDVALLLRYKKGLSMSSVEEEGGEVDDVGSEGKKDKKRKKNKKKVKLGPERPDFLKDDSKEAQEAWVPPQGQIGDGRTALNEKYGY